MKKIIAILILAATFVSCTKLEIAPNSQLTDQTSFKSKSEFLNGLAGVYTSLSVWGGEMIYYFGGGSTDEMLFPARGTDWKGDNQLIFLHTVTPTNNELNNFYNQLSNIIAVTNTYIAVIDASSFKEDNDVKVMRSEARFLRAFAYFGMVDYFGNGTLVTSASYDPSNPPKYATRTEIYNFVKTELTDLATSALPATNSYGRVDKYAAEALLAKLYLNSGIYLGQANANLPDVVTLTSDIISNSSYSLDPSYHHVFGATNGVNNVETLFTMICKNKGTACVNMSAMFSLDDSRDTYGAWASGWDGAATLPTFYRSFESTDIRRAQFIAGPQFFPDGVTPSIQTDDQGRTRQLVYAVDFTAKDPVNNADHWDGARGGKYMMDGYGNFGNMGSGGMMNSDMPILRFADVLMMKAEAEYRQNPGSTDALALVNQVRLRGGNPVAPLTSLNDANFLAERGREFAWEGWRRNDLIRFGKYGVAWDYKPADGTDRTILPIPATQIQSNPNLRQNPGYN